VRVRLLAISNHADMLGGGEHSFLDVVAGLKGSWNVIALTPGTGDLYDRLRKRSVETRVSSLSSIRPWLLHKSLADLRRILDCCRVHHASLIYANGSRAAMYGGLAAKILQIPMIWHCRIADPDPRLDPVLQRLSARIITNSRATAARFPAACRPKVRLVYNGIDIDRFSTADIPTPAGIPAAWKNILMVSRVSRWKRHDLAVAAFESIAGDFPDAHLLFVGDKDPHDPAWWNAMQMRTRRSSFSDRIHWIGPKRDVRPWYAAAFVLALPSTNEPFGPVVVEAMASGVPVVAARSGGLPEIITHGKDGFLFTPGSASDLGDFARILLKGAKTRDRMVAAARKRSRDFGLDRHVQQVSQVFTETLPDRVRMS